MIAMRNLASAALAVAAGSVMVALPSAGAAVPPAPVPQYVVQFERDCLAALNDRARVPFHQL